MPHTRFHKGDLVVLCAIVLLAAGFLLCPFLAPRTPDGAYCEIRCGDEVTRYPLSDTRTIPLSHGGHTLTVTIAHGTVSVTSADCPDRVCVRTGEISHSGDVIVCIPAEVVIRITGNEEAADYVAG